MLTRLVMLFLAGVLILTGAGCGPSAKKDAEKDRDMPKSGEKDS